MLNMLFSIEFVASAALLGAIASMIAYVYLATRAPKKYQAR